MIDLEKRTVLGSLSVIQTKSFGCCVSTMPGLFGGSMAIFQADRDGRTIFPPISKARLPRGLTQEQRDKVHDGVVACLDRAGEEPAELPVVVNYVLSEFEKNGAIKTFIIR